MSRIFLPALLILSPALPASGETPRSIRGLVLPKVIEEQPVWTTQQVAPHAQTVPASTYVVQPGETLLGVSNRSGAGAEVIAQANQLKPPYALRAGQKLSIPGGRYHLVAEGETGIAIAAAYGVKWSRMVEINGLGEPYVLHKGRRLLLPDDAPRRAPTMEERAAAFRIDIDDVLTGGQPASAAGKRMAPPSREPRPLPSNVPIATPKAFAGDFAWPVRGSILSSFGRGAGGVRNNGIDIAVPAGSSIHAAADGVVAYAGDKVAVFGGLMLINHGGGWVSVYGHASRVDVVRGQKVTKGQIIGLSGDSGYASRPKLHFELRKNRVPVDPTQQLPARPLPAKAR
ncbi:peptidoglycan DD-metalloendopeptidase family protein [Sphingobium sp. EM0848]|uniref:peptidoglycan DD-metalloendopeptidase family protein n=1 Tax=Sphingobium sp. EM0848 TaxID=2743473 RepID=UPI00159CB847|nr:peptidoglycan DD-metalloendopeptidase family protein [Sphingobium sp. EM0848]